MTDLARHYIERAHGIEQHFPGYIDAYFGPEDWKPEAEVLGNLRHCALDSPERTR